MSLSMSSFVTGGQLMTGKTVFPERTGPSPLLLPATAMKTKGTAIPSYWGRKSC